MTRTQLQAMQKGFIIGVSCLLIIGCTSSSSSSTETTTAVSSELSGGSMTIFDTTSAAFSHANPSLSGDDLTHFLTGESFFDTTWVAAPSSTEGVDGLGPFFNARSCIDCHANDGRGRPPEDGGHFLSLLLRLSIDGVTDTGAPMPDPIYGGQLQGFSILTVTGEGDASVTYEEISGTYDDGEEYTLLNPTYEISNLGYGSLDASIMISPRVAPAMIGLGLLEDVDELEILEYADENDADNDGISGKPNYVWDVENETTALGRFGWKANQPSVRQQVAGAFLGDIGITSPIFPSQNITETQENNNDELTHGGNPEIEERLFSRVVLYSKNLAVPARRDVDDETVMRGEDLFDSLNCTACHRPTLTANGETIQPFTDLLLHDMGEGLADNRPDFDASGQEWRTPPLWGIGLVETVNGHTRFLHDGRARNLEEAILWHGGEAEESKNAFKSLASSDRDALITFLESL